MQVEQLSHGFRFHDMLELRCLASSKEGEKRKWCAIRLVCGSGKFIDIVCTPRTLELQTDHQLNPIPIAKAKKLHKSTHPKGE